MARIKGNADYTFELDKLGEVVNYLNQLGFKSSDVCTATGIEKFDFYNTLRSRNIVKRRKLLELIIKEYSKDIPVEMQVLFSTSVPVPRFYDVRTQKYYNYSDLFTFFGARC